MPKYIIFLLDKDLIEAVQFGSFGCKTIFEQTLNWLASNMEQVLKIRKDDLKSKRAGSLLEEDQPKIVWVKMVIRPFIKGTKKDMYLHNVIHSIHCWMQWLKDLTMHVPQKSNLVRIMAYLT